MKPILLYPSSDELSEGPVFYQKKLWWVSIIDGCLHSFEPDSRCHNMWSVGGFVSAAVPSIESANQWILARQNCIDLFDLDTKIISQIVSFPEVQKDMRFNDGKYDPLGRFWFGSMSLVGTPGNASLYMMNRDRSVQMMRTDLSLSNGMVWNHDASIMYHVDSMECVVCRYQLEENGSIQVIEDFFKFDGNDGVPDGMCIDRMGNIYLAMWGGSKVLKIDSKTGVVLDQIDMPVSQPSSCCLNDDETTLYVTTAREGLSEDQLDDEPLAGSIFEVKLKD